LRHHSVVWRKWFARNWLKVDDGRAYFQSALSFSVVIPPHTGQVAVMIPSPKWWLPGALMFCAGIVSLGGAIVLQHATHNYKSTVAIAFGIDVGNSGNRFFAPTASEALTSRRGLINRDVPRLNSFPSTEDSFD
jgi:hypothetical protein